MFKPSFVICILVIIGWTGPTIAQSTNPTPDQPITAKNQPSDPDHKLSTQWHGTWKGKMLIANSNGSEREINIVMEIAPVKNSKNVTWRITYGEADKKMVKDYELVPVPSSPGQFMIDEKNGILLPARMVRQTLYSRFVVGKQFLSARYNLNKDKLVFEVVSSKLAADAASELVRPHEVTAVQSANLTRTNQSGH